jgi:hypothetical protein
MMRSISMKFLAALVFALDLGCGAAWATCGDGASTCFWFGGTGTLNYSSDSAHWSNTTNGPANNCGGGASACEPIAGDSVTFDANSCASSCTITINANSPALNVWTSGACTNTCTIDFSAHNNNVTANSFNLAGSGTRTINCGTGTWTVNGTSGTVYDLSLPTNLTFNCQSGGNAGTLTFSGITAIGTRTWNTGSKSYNTVNFASGAPQYGFITTNSTPNINTLNITAPFWWQITAATTTTINNAFTWNGSQANQLYIAGLTAGLTSTIHAGAASSFSWTALKDVTFTGTVTCSNSFMLGNTAGVSGGTCPPPLAGGGVIGAGL